MTPPAREACQNKGCFATFAGNPAHPNEVRHCNRGGPDGGHLHRWDLTAWKAVTA